MTEKQNLMTLIKMSKLSEDERTELKTTSAREKSETTSLT